MDNIVEKIVEIEYKAQKIIEEAEHERDYVSAHIDEEVESLKKKIFSKTRTQIQDHRTKKLEYANKEAHRIIQAAEQKSAAMEKDFATNRDKWVQCLFDHVMGR